MQSSWANVTAATANAGGLDLHLEITGRRVGAGLEAALRSAIQDGRLPAGVRLPASRTLAADLGIARNTVADAYSQLAAEGWLTARQGSGTRVAEHHAAVPEARRLDPHHQRRPRYDLRPGVPDLSAFPRTEWLAAARRAIARAPADAFGYGDPRGRRELRSALAAYLPRARGVRTNPDHIIICAGFTQALSLLCRALASAGVSRLDVEAYGHQHHRDVIRAQGMAIRPIEVDEHGAVTSQLSDGAAALLTPAHQFPLGVALASARRTDAVQRAMRTGSLLIEDDYDGEFRYDRRAVGAMQALAPDHVVYAGTASKTLAPAIRLAWLVVPERLVGELVSVKSLTDRHGSSLDELTLAEFIDSGGYDRHIRRSRLVYRRRRDLLVGALERAVPGAMVTGIAAGLHAVFQLPGPLLETDTVAAAAEHGLALDGMRRFCADGIAHPPALVLGYGTPPGHALSSAISRLVAVLTRT